MPLLKYLTNIIAFLSFGFAFIHSQASAEDILSTIECVSMSAPQALRRLEVSHISAETFIISSAPVNSNNWSTFGMVKLIEKNNAMDFSSSHSANERPGVTLRLDARLSSSVKEASASLWTAQLGTIDTHYSCALEYKHVIYGPFPPCEPSDYSNCQPSSPCSPEWGCPD